jgi:predicted ATPase
MLFGRDSDLAKLGALLNAARIVTLHGPAGIGKTALARAFAAHEPDALFCDLTCAKSYEDVCVVLAGELDVSLGGESLGRVIAGALERREKVTVVLDGAESAPDAVAQLVLELAERREARVLVTSRELMRVEGEVAMSLGPLADEEAIALFVSGAQRARPGFDPMAHGDGILELVHALSGVPLALVLAASRIAVMDVPSLVVRIREGLDLLSAKRRGAPERHASLRSALDSSLTALSEDERHVLATCTTFRGAFSLDAVEKIADAAPAHPIADTLQSLVEKSLVQRWEDETGVRFGMLEVLRRLALDALGVDPESRARHATYFAEVGSTWDGASWYGGVSDLSRLTGMRDNLVAAHAHAAASPSSMPEALLATIIALYPIYAALGPYEAFASLLSEPRDSVAAEAVAPALASRFFLVRGRGLQLSAMREDAATAFERALLYARKAHRPELAARALAYLAQARRTQGSLAEARERFEASAALFQDAGDPKSEAVVLSGLASLDLGEGDLDGAKRSLEAATSVLIAAGDPATAAMMRVDLGIVLQEMGDLEGARGVYESALAAHRAARNHRHEGITLGYLGTLEDEQGRVDAAEVALTSALVVLRAVGDTKFVAVFAACLAAVCAERDDASGAQAALGEAERAAQGSEPRIVAAVALHRSRVEGRLRPAPKELSGEARSRGAAVGLSQQSDDVRFAARMLDRVLVPEPTPSQARESAITIAEDATWLDLPGGKRIALARRAVQRRLVQHLVRERLASPGVAVTVALLVAAGWPGEKLSDASAQNRLHVALATLRADGLRDHLKRTPDGYLLDPTVEVRVEHFG